MENIVFAQIYLHVVQKKDGKYSICTNIFACCPKGRWKIKYLPKYIYMLAKGGGKYICQNIFACCPKEEVGRKGAWGECEGFSHRLMMTDMANATLPNELQTKWEKGEETHKKWIRTFVLSFFAIFWIRQIKGILLMSSKFRTGNLLE